MYYYPAEKTVFFIEINCKKCTQLYLISLPAFTISLLIFIVWYQMTPYTVKRWK